MKLTSENSIQIISQYDVVIDGTDNFESRYLIGDSCEVAGKPWIFGSIHRFEGQVSSFNLDGGPNYRDLFPSPPPPELAPNCSEAGFLEFFPGLSEPSKLLRRSRSFLVSETVCPENC